MRQFFLSLMMLCISGCYPAVPFTGDKGGEIEDTVDPDDPCQDGVMVGTPAPDSDNDEDGFAYAVDCNDCDPDINHRADEVCDGVDNDCDGDVDEDVSTTWYGDNDGDGFGDPDETIFDCIAPPDYVDNADDCDDANHQIYPGADEYCDGLDYDCDGNVYESDSVDAATWYADADNDGFGDSGVTIQSCTEPSGFVGINSDCDDTVADVNPGAIEICDEIDNDCDGLVDDADQGGATGNVDLSTGITWYPDNDGDGYGSSSSGTSVQACAQPSGHARTQTDCNDADPSINPGEAEICDDNGNGDFTDDWDNDCDPSNDITGDTYCDDTDGDGYGDPHNCVSQCTQPPNTVLDDTDCDDTRSAVNPAASELCSTSYDDDCDGTVNEDDAIDTSTFYADTDGDGYGNASSTRDACTAPSGFTTDTTDCDDTRSTVNPGADEYCSTTYDDDCDGSINEPSAVDATTWYADSDGDGYGDPTASADACTAPSGYVNRAGDCDDSDASASGGSAEVCDGTDNDCDGDVDEGVTTTYYADTDGDTFGDASNTVEDCSAPSGYVSNDTDCDDLNADANPNGKEIELPDPSTLVDNCGDSVDQDCDGYTTTDWDCLDDDGDGNANGIDPIIIVDDDGDGTNEGVFLIQDNTSYWSLGSVDLYYHGDQWGTWGALSSRQDAHTTRVVSGDTMNGWFRDISSEASGFSSPYRYVSASSASAACSTWDIVDVNDYCEAQDLGTISPDDACWYEGAASGGACSSTIGWVLFAEH